VSRIALLVMMTGLALAARAPAQSPAEMEARRFFATRAELSSLLEQLPHTSIAAQVARQRLAEGDLQIGDGVLLAVEGEPLLSDTFVVSSARELTLPMVGQVPLRGVLYAEIEPYLRSAVSRQLRDPVVRARGFVRLLVTGGVARPGVYLVPADALLSDAVMAAGGLTADSRMSDMTAQRAGVPVLAGRQMKAALAEGRTLAQVNLRSGDELMLPMNKSNTDAFNRVRMVGILLSIPLTIYSLTRIF
jgi:protein involved in polysaccharide export with SLBB domain